MVDLSALPEWVKFVLCVAVGLGVMAILYGPPGPPPWDD